MKSLLDAGADVNAKNVRYEREIKSREGETVRLTGECVLEEEWMTDICISFGM